MHELAVAQAIVAAAERHAEGRPVSVVRVRVGRLRQVVPEYLGFYSEIAAKETACEGAELEWERIPRCCAARPVAQSGTRRRHQPAAATS